MIMRPMIMRPMIMRPILAAAFSLLASAASAAPGCPALPPRAPMPPEAVGAPLPLPNWDASITQLRQKIATADPTAKHLLLIGDSITASWDPPILNMFFGRYAPVVFGLSGDTTRGTLWRLQNLDWPALHPSVAIVLIGTNNTGAGSAPADTALGVAEIIRTLRSRAPETKILLLAILPRGPDATDRLRAVNTQVNSLIAACAEPGQVTYYDAGPKLLDAQGRLDEKVSFDRLHLTPMGYYMLATALTPLIVQLEGG
jgi:lysophospholipase L1-like esterase